MKNLYSINILLIDDEAAGLRNNESLPVIVNDSDKNQYDKITKYFHVQWLQSPLDVKEFKVLSNEIEDKYSQSRYSKYGYLPEIIGFDYRLLPGYQSFNVDAIRHIMPTINMAQVLDKSSIRNYELIPDSIEEQERILEEDEDDNDYERNDKEFDSQKFRKEINQNLSHQKVEDTYFLPELPTHEDNMGCFGGGLITLQFRNHPCIGVPFTSKDDSSIKGTDAGIFEWFLSKDFAFNRKNFIENKKLTWHELIKNGVIALREKIEIQVKSEKVQLDVNQLIKFSNLETLQNLSEDARLFTFHSAYGTRTIYLDALFIDIPIESRNKRICDFFEPLLKGILSRLFSGQVASVNLFQKVLEITNQLWAAFSDTNLMAQRIQLSQWCYFKEKGNYDTTEDLDAKINSLKSILKTGDKFKKILTLRTIIADLKIKGADKKVVVELVTNLMLCKTYFRYKQVSTKKLSGKMNADFAPSATTYLVGLYPLIDEDIMAFHGKSEKYKSLFYDQNVNLNEGYVTDIIDGSYKLTPEVKYLLNSYWLTLCNENSIKEESIINGKPNWI
jgi:hypothetical protein